MTLQNSVHGQTYHSLAGAWSECEEVFLNPVIAHIREHQWQSLKILDVGFGLGANWLSFVNFGLQNDFSLQIDSLENDSSLFSISKNESLQSKVSLKAWDCYLQIFQNKSLEEKNLKAKIHLQDGKKTLDGLLQQHIFKNIILQDAFSPQVNPELWDEEYFEKLSQLCESNAILVTYSAASEVQRILKRVGFEVFKKPGFAGKRERVVAVKR